MTIDKLRLIATASVQPRFKALWLTWWNAPPTMRAAYKFPTPDSKIPLATWIIKASFWAEVIYMFHFSKLQFYCHTQLFNYYCCTCSLKTNFFVNLKKFMSNWNPLIGEPLVESGLHLSILRATGYCYGIRHSCRFLMQEQTLCTKKKLSLLSTQGQLPLLSEYYTGNINSITLQQNLHFQINITLMFLYIYLL